LPADLDHGTHFRHEMNRSAGMRAYFIFYQVASGNRPGQFPAATGCTATDNLIIRNAEFSAPGKGSLQRAYGITGRFKVAIENDGTIVVKKNQVRRYTADIKTEVYHAILLLSAMVTHGRK
jgi:hypothetical protein